VKDGKVTDESKDVKNKKCDSPPARSIPSDVEKNGMKRKRVIRTREAPIVLRYLLGKGVNNGMCNTVVVRWRTRSGLGNEGKEISKEQVDGENDESSFNSPQAHPLIISPRI